MCGQVSNEALITADGSYGMLRTWIDTVRRAKVDNFLVIALDHHTGACLCAYVRVILSWDIPVLIAILFTSQSLRQNLHCFYTSYHIPTHAKV